MHSLDLTRIRRDESGMALVEILVSAMLLLIVAAGVFTAFDAGTRATAEERHRARAHALAEDDVARMRAMKVSELANLNESRTVIQDDFEYDIVSRGSYGNDPTATSSCVEGLGSGDFLKISSTVRWDSLGSRPPVVVSSIVSGQVVGGSLQVEVVDRDNVGIPGVGLSGSGPRTFSGVTGPAGCVIWRGLPAGNYQLTVSAGDKVDEDGNPPPGNPPTPTKTVSVVAQGTNTYTLLLEDPGTIPVNFTTRRYTDNVSVASSFERVTVQNTGMTGIKTFGTTGAFVSSLTAAPLFPFTSPYSVFLDTCRTTDPAPGAPVGSATPQPGLSSPVALPLPALHLTVYNGSTTSSSRASGAIVKINDVNCSGETFRTLTTNSSGQLPDPGLPYSSYQICASDSVSGTLRRNYVRTGTGSPPPIENVVVQNTSTGTVRNIFLQGSGNQTGSTCPSS